MRINTRMISIVIRMITLISRKSVKTNGLHRKNHAKKRAKP